MNRFLYLFLFLGAINPIWTAPHLEFLQLHRDYTNALSLEDEKEQRPALLKVRIAYQRLLLSTQHPSATLHYNLGTLHLKLEEYGQAIHQLKQAHSKDPNDTRVVDHLQRASRQAGVTIVKKDQTLVGGWAQDTWAAIPVSWMQGAIVAIALLSFLIVLNSPPHRKLSRWLYSSVILIVFTAITFLRQSGWGISHEIILMEDINPRSGVGLAYPGILAEGQLKSGHCGTLLRVQGGWTEVDWYDSGKGWVPSNKVSEISN